LLGGYVGSGFQTPTATVRRLAPDAAAWLDRPSLPEPRAAGAAAWDGARVVYGGGVGGAGVSDTVFALEDSGWGPIGRLSVGREHLAAAGDGQGSAWFLGGRLGGLESNLATVDIVEGEAVSALVELPTARGGVAAFWHERTGTCLVGGEGPNGTFADVECVARDGTLQTLPTLAVPRHGLGAAVLDGTAYVLLGGPQPGLTVSDAVEALDLDP
jgi:non-specific serine/threonine protein kinase